MKVHYISFQNNQILSGCDIYKQVYHFIQIRTSLNFCVSRPFSAIPDSGCLSSRDALGKKYSTQPRQNLYKYARDTYLEACLFIFLKFEPKSTEIEQNVRGGPETPDGRKHHPLPQSIRTKFTHKFSFLSFKYLPLYVSSNYMTYILKAKSYDLHLKHATYYSTLTCNSSIPSPTS